MNEMLGIQCLQSCELGSCWVSSAQNHSHSQREKSAASAKDISFAMKAQEKEVGTKPKAR